MSLGWPVFFQHFQQFKEKLLPLAKPFEAKLLRLYIPYNHCPYTPGQHKWLSFGPWPDSNCRGTKIVKVSNGVC